MAKPFNDRREKYRNLFFWVGLVVALFLILLAFQWKTYYELRVSEPEKLTDILEMEESVPRTKRSEPEKPKKLENPKPGKEDSSTEPMKIKPIDFGTDMGDDDTTLVDIYNDRPETDVVMNVFLVSKRPIYPGCENILDEQERFNCLNQKIHEFVRNEARYPEMARTMRIQEKVYVSFVIGTDGYIKQVEIERGGDKSLMKEAIRVIESLPRLEPGMQGGRKVSVQMTIPVDFKLQ